MLVPYNPFRRVTKFQADMNRLFDIMRSPDDEELSLGDFNPQVNINEREIDFVISADLPGTEQKDITVNIENNILTLSGERKLEKDEKSDNYHRVERSYGRFTRSFRLPDTVDEEKVSASYSNGVLEVILPKSEKAKPKQISINVE